MVINVGAQLIHILRDLVGESLGEYLVDLCFQPHITLFRRNEMNVTEREQLGQSLEEFSTGSLICDRVALQRGKTESQAAGEVSAQSLM